MNFQADCVAPPSQLRVHRSCHRISCCRSGRAETLALIHRPLCEIRARAHRRNLVEQVTRHVLGRLAYGINLTAHFPNRTPHTDNPCGRHLAGIAVLSAATILNGLYITYLVLNASSARLMVCRHVLKSIHMVFICVIFARHLNACWAVINYLTKIVCILIH